MKSAPMFIGTKGHGDNKRGNSVLNGTSGRPSLVKNGQGNIK